MLKTTFRWLASLVLILPLVLLPVWPGTTTVRAEGQSVLLLVDSQAKGTPKEGNAEALERVFGSFSAQVTVKPLDRYEPGLMKSYGYVAVLRNAEDYALLPPAFRSDYEAYTGRYLQIGAPLPDKARAALGVEETRVGQDAARLQIGTYAQAYLPVAGISYITKTDATRYGTLTSDLRQTDSPFGVAKAGVAYIPYFQPGSLFELTAGYVIRDWLSIPGEGRYYVLFQNIYPFSNLEGLSLLADRLYEAGIPFIASVRPVLSNSDYPAMKRYLETLKHLQFRNGSIVVNTPVVTSTLSQDVTTLKRQMGDFLNALADYGIAPLGLGAEMYWTYDRHYASQGLGYFDSLVLFPNAQAVYRDRVDTSSVLPNTVYTIKESDFHQIIPKGKPALAPPMNTAIVYEFPEEEGRFTQTLVRLYSEWTTFADYKMAPHTVKTEAHNVSARYGQLSIDGRGLDVNTAKQEVSSEHVYVAQSKAAFAALFTVQNNVFIVLIGLTLLVFTGFFIIGYQMYKRKYNHRSDSEVDL